MAHLSGFPKKQVFWDGGPGDVANNLASYFESAAPAACEHPGHATVSVAAAQRSASVCGEAREAGGRGGGGWTLAR